MHCNKMCYFCILCCLLFDLKPCSYWSSGILDAIIECGNAIFIETIKCRVPPNYQRMIIYMVPILILIWFPVDMKLLYVVRLVVN